jgi:dCMP deaminase
MRPGDHKAFIAKANEVAQRSNCVRRAVGAVIVRQGEVVSSGWNGVLGSYADCREAGCPRCISGGDTGSGYETCICIHAEQRAIADAAKRGVSTIDSTLYVNLRPCLQCLAIAKASGVREIFYGEDWTYSDEIEKVYCTLSAQFDSFTRVVELQGSELAGSLG